MTMWVLDTDSLSLLERGNPKIQERLRQVTADSVAISIVTAEEMADLTAFEACEIYP